MLTRKIKLFSKRTLKQKNSQILKKLAIAFAIVIVAASIYIRCLSPYTLEAKQRVELESKSQQLTETLYQLEQQKSDSVEQQAEHQKKLDEVQKKLEETERQLQAKRDTARVYAASSPRVTPSSNVNNEAAVYKFLINQGFNKAQAAGIMGNLRQEHNYRTDGDGLAQWIGSRRANLLAQPNPYSLETQLNFLMTELNGGYSKVKAAILATNDVRTATILFQNGYERCGDCRQDKRIQYALDIYNRY